MKVGFLSLLSVILTILNANNVIYLNWYVVLMPAVIDLAKEMYFYLKAQRFRKEMYEIFKMLEGKKIDK